MSKVKNIFKNARGELSALIMLAILWIIFCIGHP